MIRSTLSQIDNIISFSLQNLAKDKHVRNWCAKERDWVNYYAHNFLFVQCSSSTVIKHIAQIGIEVSVPQPPGYTKPTVPRDIVIWPRAGMTCWNEKWEAIQHPLAIIEWKVHRIGRRNMKVNHERSWLRTYCKWKPSVVAYAIEVNADRPGCPIHCTRFLNKTEVEWPVLNCS